MLTFDKLIEEKSMSFFKKASLLTLFAFFMHSLTASAGPISRGKENDTSNLKSNIVIFKMMTSPAAPASTPKGKTLKKAGSVARTSSNTHTEATNKPYVPEG